MSIQPCIEPICTRSKGLVDLLIEPQTKDLGEFEVRRVLPSKERQRVGPFIFFDHAGPAEFGPGQGVNVRPHPHIGIATVTYLFDGEITHRDSLGYVQAITPGAVNLMTAGRGVVHSERTSEEVKATGSSLHGIQSWLALPTELEETDPAFVHYPAEDIPVIEKDRATIYLIAGSAFGETSPVTTTSPTVYAEIRAAADSTIDLPSGHDELAVYVVDGKVDLSGETIVAGTMAVLQAGETGTIHSVHPARYMFLGGGTLPGERKIWWNFVSSSDARMQQAKEDWKGHRFEKVPGETGFIPLPDD